MGYVIVNLCLMNVDNGVLYMVHGTYISIHFRDDGIDR